jgi:formylglycine-generating enzyme required for sulfatase activity
VRSRKAQRRRQSALAGGVAAMIVISLAAWLNHDALYALGRYIAVTRPFASANIWPYVLAPEAETALKPDPAKSFRECAPRQQDNDYCPDMIVVPAGSFMMGSPSTEDGRYANESPQHIVAIAEPFAVSKYEVTFAEWDTCVAYGACKQTPADSGWGRGQRPVIYVNWDDARQYAAWLSKITGKPYRLLSEAEYEYAARAGTLTAYPWGDDIKLNGTAMTNCDGCGSQWDKQQTAPVGSFAANRFGLYDMVGNVWEWVEDCYHDDYNGAPADGSPWIGNCGDRVVRAGAWDIAPRNVRSALRAGINTDNRANYLGFRVARALTAGAVTVAPGVR